MSSNPFPFFIIAEHDRPEQIESRIKLLIRLYLLQHEVDIAIAVVEHINAILAYPHYIVDTETRCQFRQLAKHWRCLAWANDYKSKKKNAQSNSLTLKLKKIQYLQ